MGDITGTGTMIQTGIQATGIDAIGTGINGAVCSGDFAFR